jgi:hypothetical protein
MTTNVNKLNKIVLTFIEENADSENIEELWMDAEIQKQLKTLCVAKRSVGGRKNKDPNAPKRGKSAYLFFCANHRDDVKTDLGNEAKATDVTRELGARWNLLKESKKADDKKELLAYVADAATDKARYESEKEEYVPPADFEDEPNRRGGKKKSATKGPKRAKSAYLYFCADHRDAVKAENDGFKATEVTAELGRRWNELKAAEDRSDEMEVYVNQAAEDKIRYQTEKDEQVGAEHVKAPKKTTTKKAAPKKAPAKKVVAPKKAPAKGKKVAPKKAPAKGKKLPKVEDDEDDEEVLEEEAVVAPKRAVKPSSRKQNGYQLFCADKRHELKADHPKAKATEITKKLSAAWKALSKEEQLSWKCTPVAE